MGFGKCHLLFGCGVMKFFVFFLLLLQLFASPQGSALSRRRSIRGLNTTLQTNFNGTYQRRNPCNNAEIETSSYVASHEFRHHTKGDNWSDYTHKCSAIINSFLQAIGNLVRFNNKQNGTFNFHINTSITQKQDDLCEGSHQISCESSPTIVIEATGCEMPAKSPDETKQRTKVVSICGQSANEDKIAQGTAQPLPSYTNERNQKPTQIVKKWPSNVKKPQDEEIWLGEGFSSTSQYESETTSSPLQSSTETPSTGQGFEELQNDSWTTNNPLIDLQHTETLPFSSLKTVEPENSSSTPSIDIPQNERIYEYEKSDPTPAAPSTQLNDEIGFEDEFKTAVDPTEGEPPTTNIPYSERPFQDSNENIPLSATITASDSSSYYPVQGENSAEKTTSQPVTTDYESQYIIQNQPSMVDVPQKQAFGDDLRKQDPDSRQPSLLTSPDPLSTTETSLANRPKSLTDKPTEFSFPTAPAFNTMSYPIATATPDYDELSDQSWVTKPPQEEDFSRDSKQPNHYEGQTSFTEYYKTSPAPPSFNPTTTRPFEFSPNSDCDQDETFPSTPAPDYPNDYSTEAFALDQQNPKTKSNPSFAPENESLDFHDPQPKTPTFSTANQESFPGRIPNSNANNNVTPPIFSGLNIDSVEELSTLQPMTPHPPTPQPKSLDAPSNQQYVESSEVGEFQQTSPTFYENGMIPNQFRTTPEPKPERLGEYESNSRQNLPVLSSDLLERKTSNRFGDSQFEAPAREFPLITSPKQGNGNIEMTQFGLSSVAPPHETGEPQLPTSPLSEYQPSVKDEKETGESNSVVVNRRTSTTLRPYSQPAGDGSSSQFSDSFFPQQPQPRPITPKIANEHELLASEFGTTAVPKRQPPLNNGIQFANDRRTALLNQGTPGSFGGPESQIPTLAPSQQFSSTTPPRYQSGDAPPLSPGEHSAAPAFNSSLKVSESIPSSLSVAEFSNQFASPPQNNQPFVNYNDFTPDAPPTTSDLRYTPEKISFRGSDSVSPPPNTPISHQDRRTLPSPDFETALVPSRPNQVHPTIPMPIPSALYSERSAVGSPRRQSPADVYDSDSPTANPTGDDNQNSFYSEPSFVHPKPFYSYSPTTKRPNFPEDQYQMTPTNGPVFQRNRPTSNNYPMTPVEQTRPFYSNRNPDSARSVPVFQGIGSSTQTFGNRPSVTPPEPSQFFDGSRKIPDRFFTSSSPESYSTNDYLPPDSPAVGNVSQDFSYSKLSTGPQRFSQIEDDNRRKDQQTTLSPYSPNTTTTTTTITDIYSESLPLEGYNRTNIASESLLAYPEQFSDGQFSPRPASSRFSSGAYPISLNENQVTSEPLGVRSEERFTPSGQSPKYGTTSSAPEPPIVQEPPTPFLDFNGNQQKQEPLENPVPFTARPKPTTAFELPGFVPSTPRSKTQFYDQRFHPTVTTESYPERQVTEPERSFVPDLPRNQRTFIPGTSLAPYNSQESAPAVQFSRDVRPERVPANASPFQQSSVAHPINYQPGRRPFLGSRATTLPYESQLNSPPSNIASVAPTPESENRMQPEDSFLPVNQQENEAQFPSREPQNNFPATTQSLSAPSVSNPLSPQNSFVGYSQTESNTELETQPQISTGGNDQPLPDTFQPSYGPKSRTETTLPYSNDRPVGFPVPYTSAARLQTTPSSDPTQNQHSQAFAQPGRSDALEWKTLNQSPKTVSSGYESTTYGEETSIGTDQLSPLRPKFQSRPDYFTDDSDSNLRNEQFPFPSHQQVLNAPQRDVPIGEYPYGNPRRRGNLPTNYFQKAPYATQAPSEGTEPSYPENFNTEYALDKTSMHSPSFAAEPQPQPSPDYTTEIKNYKTTESTAQTFGTTAPFQFKPEAIATNGPNPPNVQTTATPITISYNPNAPLPEPSEPQPLGQTSELNDDVSPQPQPTAAVNYGRERQTSEYQLSPAPQTALTYADRLSDVKTPNIPPGQQDLVLVSPYGIDATTPTTYRPLPPSFSQTKNFENLGGGATPQPKAPEASAAVSNASQNKTVETFEQDIITTDTPLAPSRWYQPPNPRDRVSYRRNPFYNPRTPQTLVSPSDRLPEPAFYNRFAPGASPRYLKDEAVAIPELPRERPSNYEKSQQPTETLKISDEFVSSVESRSSAEDRSNRGFGYYSPGSRTTPTSQDAFAEYPRPLGQQALNYNMGKTQSDSLVQTSSFEQTSLTPPPSFIISSSNETEVTTDSSLGYPPTGLKPFSQTKSYSETNAKLPDTLTPSSPTSQTSLSVTPPQPPPFLPYSSKPPSEHTTKVVEEILTTDFPTALTGSPIETQLAFADKLLNKSIGNEEVSFAGQTATSPAPYIPGTRRSGASTESLSYSERLYDDRPGKRPDDQPIRSKTMPQYFERNGQIQGPLPLNQVFSFAPERPQTLERPTSPSAGYDQELSTLASKNVETTPNAWRTEHASTPTDRQLIDRPAEGHFRSGQDDFRQSTVRRPVNIEVPTYQSSPVKNEPQSNPLLQTLESHLTSPLHESSQPLANSPEPLSRTSPVPNDSSTLEPQNGVSAFPPYRDFVPSRQPETGVPAQDVTNKARPDSLVTDLTTPSNKPDGTPTGRFGRMSRPLRTPIG